MKRATSEARHSAKLSRAIFINDTECKNRMLYLIGLGLGDEKDLTLKAQEIIQHADVVYLEEYTSVTPSREKLEKVIKTKIVSISRGKLEEQSAKFIAAAKTRNICILIGGDPLTATTHIELFKEAHNARVLCNIVHNASIVTAVGETGLQVYKFGRTSSIPFPETTPNVETPYTVIQENQKHGLHTLLLLDLNPKEKKFLTIPKAIEYLLLLEKKKKKKVFTPTTLCVACARLGSKEQVIKAGSAAELEKEDFGVAPYCLIVPGKLHFLEEEMLELWQKK